MATAGFHRIDITPQVGTPMAGFAARRGVSTGVHDPLFAHALVIESSGTAVAFVSVDVLGLAADFVDRVRRRIEARTGLPQDAVMIAATHTHSGPVTVSTFFTPGETLDPAYMNRLPQDAVMIAATHTHSGPVTVSTFFNPGETLDPAYMNRLAAAIEDAVAAAWEHRAPARIGIGSGRVSGIGKNRRTPDHLPVDDEVGIIEVASADGGPRGVLINHACHPTVLGPDNLLLTGDFPAFTIERIQAELGEDSFALFVNGAQGNISVGHSSELSAIGVITPGRTFERAREVGHRLADAVLATLSAIPTYDELPVSHARRTVHLPFNTYPAPAETAAALSEAQSALNTLELDGAEIEQVGPARTRRLYASIRNFYAQEAAALPDGRLPIEVQAIRLGAALFVAIPGELFVEIALRMKTTADHPLFIMGITNGYIGYLPTREAYAAGGYEVVSAKVTEAAEDLLVTAVRELDHRLTAGVA